MKFTVDTEAEQIDLELSQAATRLWLESVEADKRSEEGGTAQCLRDSIRHMLEGAAAKVPGDGTYRVVWQRDQVIVMLPK